MQRQRGNFLLQALLAVTLIFAFIPFFAGRLASRDMAAQMYATTRQVSVAQTAARIFVRENIDNLPYSTSVIYGNAFIDTLEPYGLPLGFVPRTALGQQISLVIEKDEKNLSAYLELTGGKLTQIQLAELARRIGFYATHADGVVLVGLALEDNYSDIVRRDETSLENSAFLSDLKLDNVNLNNTNNIIAKHGAFDTAQFNTLSIIGAEAVRKETNEITNILSGRTVFQSTTGESALTVTRGELVVGTVNARTVSAFGDTGAFSSNSASVYDFSLTAGRNSFSGPAKWHVHGNVMADRINLSVERLEINSYLNASRGQDVYVIPDSLESSANSGISTDVIFASNITMRDQTSDALSRGDSGAVVLDIRPAGTSVLPDVLIDGINNNAFTIIKNPGADDAETTDCKSIIMNLDSRYSEKSLAQHIICQYVYWQRLEQRIDIKQCLMDGRSGCI